MSPLHSESVPYRESIPIAEAVSFDPYYRWLGIPPEEQPPDHYRLLGIRRFEENLDVIATAADRQTVHLKTLQLGPRSILSEKLLNEVAAAKVCLLVPEKKREYDDQLRARMARRVVPEPPPAVGPSPALDFLQQAERVRGDGEAREETSGVSQWVRRHPRMAIGGTAAIVVGGMVGLFAASGDRGKPTAGPSKPAATKKLPAQAPEISKPIVTPLQPGSGVEGGDSVQKAVEEAREEAKKRLADPFRDCPVEINLPPIETKTDNMRRIGGRPVVCPVILTKIHTAADIPWELTLEGDGAERFTVDRTVLPVDGDGPPPPVWVVRLRDAVAGKDQTPTVVAQFIRFTNELHFGWAVDPLPSPSVADQLRLCGLQIRVGSDVRTINLSTFEARSKVPIEPDKDGAGDLSLLQPITVPPMPPPAPGKPGGVPVPPVVPSPQKESTVPPVEERDDEEPVKPVVHPSPKRRSPAKKEVQKEAAAINVLERLAKMDAQTFVACIKRGKVQLKQATANTPAHLQLGPSDGAHIHVPLEPEEMEGEREYFFDFVRVAGSDSVEFDFPVGKSMATLVLSGWNGDASGISRVNGLDAVDDRNPTKIPRKQLQLGNGVPYRVGIRVTPVQRLEDGDELVDIIASLGDRTGRLFPICRYTGRASLLTMHRDRVQQRQGIGVASWNDANRVLVYSMVDQPVKGPVRGVKSHRR